MSVAKVRRIRCSCNRGILRPSVGIDAWAEACPVCRGRGELSVRRVARMAGQCPNTVARFIAGKRLRVRTLLRYVEVFQKMEDEIMAGTHKSFRASKGGRQGELFG